VCYKERQMWTAQKLVGRSDSTEVVSLDAQKRETWCKEGARLIHEGVHIEKHMVIGVKYKNLGGSTEPPGEVAPPLHMLVTYLSFFKFP